MTIRSKRYSRIVRIISFMLMVRARRLSTVCIAADISVSGRSVRRFIHMPYVFVIPGDMCPTYRLLPNWIEKYAKLKRTGKTNEDIVITSALIITAIGGLWRTCREISIATDCTYKTAVRYVYALQLAGVPITDKKVGRHTYYHVPLEWIERYG